MNLWVFKRLTWIVLVFELCALSPLVTSQIQGCSIEAIDLLPCLNQGKTDIPSFDICCKILTQVVDAGFHCLCSLVSSPIPLVSTPLSLPLSNCFISVPPLSLCKDLAPVPVVLPPPAIPKELTQPSAPTIVPPPPEIQIPKEFTQPSTPTIVPPPPEIQIPKEFTQPSTPTPPEIQIPIELPQPSAPSTVPSPPEMQIPIELPPPQPEMQVPLNPTREDNGNCTTVATTQPDSIANVVPNLSGSHESSNGKDETKFLLLKCLFLSLMVVF